MRLWAVGMRARNRRLSVAKANSELGHFQSWGTSESAPVAAVSAGSPYFVAPASCSFFSPFYYSPRIRGLYILRGFYTGISMRVSDYIQGKNDRPISSADR